jgi:peptidoglycan/xylan/chitin deacetylase (PgdA/CDA1 family)
MYPSRRFSSISDLDMDALVPSGSASALSTAVVPSDYINPRLRPLRNAVCSALALSLIASGAVRRARQAAFKDGVITAIYFHNPSRTLFEKCIRWLMRNGYVFVSADDVLAFLRGRPVPRGSVWISFDDGFRDMLENALPAVRKYKLPITLFLASGILKSWGGFPWVEALGPARDSAISAPASRRHCITTSELKQMQESAPVTVGAHTVHHVITTSCTADEIRFELGQCRVDLESLSGAPVEYFAYPNGRFNGSERRYLEEFRYSLAVTTENAFITRKTEWHLVPRFSVADKITFPEAICNMTGVWRPAIDSIRRLLPRL